MHITPFMLSRGGKKNQGKSEFCKVIPDPWAFQEQPAFRGPQCFSNEFDLSSLPRELL